LVLQEFREEDPGREDDLSPLNPDIISRQDICYKIQ